MESLPFGMEKSDAPHPHKKADRMDMSILNTSVQVVQVSGKVFKLTGQMLLLFPRYVYQKKKGEYQFRNELVHMGLPSHIRNALVKSYRANGIKGLLSSSSMLLNSQTREPEA